MPKSERPAVPTAAALPLTRSAAGLSALARELTGIAWLWVPILLLVAVDWLWNRYAALEFSGWSSISLALTFLVAAFVFYTVTGRDRRLADASLYTALWVVFTVSGVILTYLAASLAMPLWDGRLARMDAAIGFDWWSYHSFVLRHPVFHVALWLSYASLLPQIIGSTMYFALTDRRARNQELLAVGLLSALITTALFAWVPALGPFPMQTEYYPVLVGLRSGVKEFSMGHLQGIITMPSYHATLAFILIYAHRPRNPLFLPILAVNSLMMFSIPEGHHYLVDIFAGVLIAIASIYLVARIFEKQIDAAGNSAEMENAGSGEGSPFSNLSASSQR